MTARIHHDHLLRAIDLFRRGAFDPADALLAAIPVIAPEFGDAVRLRAAIALKRGDPSSALGFVGPLIALAPALGEALANLGAALAALAQWPSAAQAFERLARLDAAALAPRFHAARAHLAANAPDRAAALAREVLAGAPQSAEAAAVAVTALVEAARRDQEAGRPRSALAGYHEALALDPADTTAWRNGGVAWRAIHALERSRTWIARALRLSPDNPDLYSNLGMSLLAEGAADSAIIAYRTAQALDPSHPHALTNEGIAQLLAGRFDIGWRRYEWRLDPSVQPPHTFKAPLWRGEAVPMARVMLHAEQGLGDTIQFARYAPLVADRGARVILCVQPALATLLRRLDPRVRVIASGDPLPEFEFQCPLLNLPGVFGADMTNIPWTGGYLRADPDRVAAWRARLGPSPRWIGLAVSGNPGHRNDHQRSVALAQLAPILDLPDATFVLVQKDPRPDDLACARAHGRILAPPLGDFDDTAALMAALDLVVSVDSAPIHLAGALGRPAALLLPFAPDWRWLLGHDRSPWYASLRLYRQGRPGDWPSAIESLAADLKAAP